MLELDFVDETTLDDEGEGCYGLVYGEEKSGKTGLADDPKMKNLVIDMGEGVTSVLKNAILEGRTKVIRIETKPGAHAVQQLTEIFNSIKRGYFQIGGKKVPYDFDAVWIDSLTRFADHVKDYIAKIHAPNRKREIQDQFGCQGDWNDYKQIILGTAKSWQTLTKRGKESTHAFWIAHSMNADIDEATGAVRRTAVNLQGNNNPEIFMSIVDSIFYTFKRETPIIDPQSKKQIGSETKYGLWTKNGKHGADYRVPKNVKPDLEKAIENPVMSDILERLGYKATKTL